MNKQEALWAGDFGNGYIERNQSAEAIAANTAFLARALRRADKITSCIDFGAGTGMTLQALKALYPAIDAHGIDINTTAAAALADVIPASNIRIGSFGSFKPGRTFDLVMTKGVLICIHPDNLPATYAAMHGACGRYILISEYFSSTPAEIIYRGNTGVLWKRDFAGDLLDAFPDLSLVDYGFSYRRDPRSHHFDATWFLLERR